MNKIFLLICFFIQLAGVAAKPPIDSLRKAIDEVVQSKKATVGVAIQGPENGDTLTIGNGRHYPMQSVYKFHLALAVLNMVDKGELSLDQKVLIKKKDLRPDTWSPLREKYPEGNIELTINELITYTVSYSDNNCCDILFRIAGGTKNVEKYIKSLGIKDVAIRATEAEMHRNWKVQFLNRTTPYSVVQLLERFFKGTVLSKTSTDFLMNVMTNSHNPGNRILGMMSESTAIAHKSGTSGRDRNGIVAACNDIGIVTLPDGRHFTIAVFVSDSKENDETNARIIAEITKLSWEYFLKGNK